MVTGTAWTVLLATADTSSEGPKLLIGQNWSEQSFHILTREHFYHVGSTEDLRHPMIEALITNFPAHAAREAGVETEQMAFFDRPLSEPLASQQSAAR